MRQHIPNLITLLNLAAGCVACILVVQGHLVYGAFFVFIGIFFDFFDGLMARVLNTQSSLGLQLDSLADVVTSGVVPGLVMYKLLALSLNVSGDLIDPAHWSSETIELGLKDFLPFLALLIPMSSAYRLARFNIDEDQQFYFKGLPTPANALLIMSLPLILEYQNSDVINAQVLNPWILVVLTLMSTFLLNAPVKLFALKFKSYDFSSNGYRYIFIVVCLILLLIFRFASIPLIILLYILMSLGNQRQIK